LQNPEAYESYYPSHNGWENAEKQNAQEALRHRFGDCEGKSGRDQQSDRGKNQREPISQTAELSDSFGHSRPG
jgi:hypothetical protein